MSCHRGHIDCVPEFKLRGQFSWRSPPEGFFSERRAAVQRLCPGKFDKTDGGRGELRQPAKFKKDDFISVRVQPFPPCFKCVGLSLRCLVKTRTDANLISQEQGGRWRERGQREPPSQFNYSSKNLTERNLKMVTLVEIQWTNLRFSCPSNCTHTIQLLSKVVIIMQHSSIVVFNPVFAKLGSKQVP